MQDAEIKLFCRELASGQGYVGQLLVNDEQMELKLFSFEGQFQLNTQQTELSVLLENGRIATLLDCLPLAEGSAWNYERRVWKGIVIPNIVLFGSDGWSKDDTVRSVTFRFTESDTSLLVPTAIDRRSEPSAQTGNSADDEFSGSTKHIWEVDNANNLILKARSKDMNIRIWSALSYDSGSQKTSIDLEPTITIDFDEGFSIDQYILEVCDVVSLFSLAIGFASRPFKIQPSPRSTRARLQQFREETYRGDFEARYTWGTEPLKADSLWAGASVLQVLNSNEREATEKCLVAWLNRRAAWRPAYGLMNRSLKNRAEMDGERLRTATTWFENIPLDEPSLTADQVSALCSAAIAEAKRLGLNNVDKRLEGVISQLSRESLSMRFGRLIPTLRTRFGESLVPVRLEEDCKKAVSLRGTATHATLKGDEKSFIELSRAVYAVELVAFLLTIRDLPISEEALSRLAFHPLTEYLRFRPPK
jgi:hypothetical protein